MNSGVSSAQVVVKELQASASVQEQMQFLEEVQPYRALKHSNLLQCLAQCAEVTPYLLVMEFCPLVSCCPGGPGAFAEPGHSLALPVSGATPSLGASHPP